MSNDLRRRANPRAITASRNVVVRDFAIFQLKLFLDGLKDVALSALSLGALIIDMVAGGGRRPRVFYSVLAMSERFDLWLNLSGAISRLENEDLDDDGLFAASEAGSDTLLGKVEEIVRGPETKRRGSPADPEVERDEDGPST